VICQDWKNITPMMSATAMPFETSPERVLVKARCAPITSLFSRETSAPVCERVKNATGIDWTWSNTTRRRSKMMPSPSFAPYQRIARFRRPSTAASPAMIAAMVTTPRWVPFAPVSSLTMSPARTGVATPMAAMRVTSPMKNPMSRR
jgi:hypothetical protein